MPKIKFSLLVLVIFGCFIFLSKPVFVSAAAGAIDATDRYAWTENAGWLDFGTSQGNVIVGDSALSGYAWGESIGWVSLNCSNTGSCATSNYKVANDGNGNLSGYAWGENAGWINFNPAGGGVSIDSSGNFSGYAWGENIGWIVFNCVTTTSCVAVNYKVSTDWRPAGAASQSSQTAAAVEHVPGQAGPAERTANAPVSTITIQSPVSPPPVLPAPIAAQFPPSSLSQGVASTIQNVAQPLENAGQAILNILNPPKNTTLPPAPKPGVTQVAPPALMGNWSLLPLSVNDFVLGPLPGDLQVIEQQFPQLGQTFSGLGVSKITDLGKLQNAQIILPGLAESAGLAGATLSNGALSPFTSLSLAGLPQEVKQKLPGEFVFTGANGIDLDSKLTLNDRGSIEQVVKTIANQTVHLTVKVDHPALSVRGYLTVKNAVAARPNFFTAFLASAGDAVLGIGGNNASQNLLLQEFDYSDPDGDGIYEADVAAPAVNGQYDVMTAIKYADASQERKELHLTLVVDPEGYVYTRIGGDELRIGNVQVSLFWMNPQTNDYELWPAQTYRQTNPQTTDKTGQYDFLVPPGKYLIKATAFGYNRYEGGPFEVAQSSGINENIQLAPDHWNWRNIDWKFWLLISSILVSALLIASKIKQRSKNT